MRFARLLPAVLLLGYGTVSLAQQIPPRPKILGLAHVAFAAHDLDASRKFYSGMLGYEEVSQWKDADGSTAFTFFKINDHQYIELTPEKAAGTDRFGDVSFETDDAEAMRKYLAARGIAVPAAVTKGRIGNVAFKVTDPAGHAVEFVQYMAGGQTVAGFGQHLGTHRVSEHMTHAGLIVTRLAPEYSFYTEVLGFTETWRGSSKGDVLSWVNLKMPDSPDYVEFMLEKTEPEPTKRGSQHHVCLRVESVAGAVAQVKASPGMASYSRTIDEHLGINRKRQANLFDPDGTRVELMEPVTVDGKVTPSSTAPPPGE